jgi:hypothetical protein
MLCACAGGAALAWLGWQKMFNSESIANRPLLMLGVLLAVIGVQFICTGIVTELLARTYFESGSTKSYAVREVLGEPGFVGQAAVQGEPLFRTMDQR